MPIPTSDQMQAYIEDILYQAAHLAGEYHWMEPSSHTPPKRGAREKSSGGSNRDLADDVFATRRFRERLERAAKDIVEARNRLLTASAAMSDAAKLLDPPESIERHERTVPHPADRGDLERAREAKRRRQERAQKSGDWSEVTG